MGLFSDLPKSPDGRGLFAWVADLYRYDSPLIDAAALSIAAFGTQPHDLILSELRTCNSSALGLLSTPDGWRQLAALYGAAPPPSWPAIH